MGKLFWFYQAFILLSGSLCLGDFPIGYRSYTQWQNLPQLRLGVRAGLASSYDRTGRNQDWSWYEWPEGHITTETTCTIKTIQGPGVIYRFWMPHCVSRGSYVVRMYFDGESTPRIDTTSDTIFDGLFSYFDAPFVDTCAGGQTSYEPITFEDSVMIETVNHEGNSVADHHYYQYTYLTYPEIIDVNSWTGTLNPSDQNDRDAAALLFEQAGQNPDGISPASIEINIPASVIDTEIILADINGPGVIRELRIKMHDANDTELKGLNLQVSYDGETAPDINVPVAYFFGAGELRSDYSSLPIGVDSNDGFYCYWPMPFKESILIRLYNTTPSVIDINSAKIEYESKQLDHHTCYLHAIEKNTIKSGSPYKGTLYHNILSTNGQGHYVGDFVYLVQDVSGLVMLEGDDVIYSGGELVQNGTGLEDAYNGGAYYNWVAIIPDEPEGPYPQSATRPLNGVLYVNNADTSRADQYRWRIADCIPFTESIEVNVECLYSYNGTRWKSVGFWYQLPHLLEDIDENGIVDFEDYSKLALHWKQSDCAQCAYTDFTGDAKVDYEDLQELIDAWLSQS